GLTVSGDNPVFVQLVKEDGAAMRAGVQTGDRIIKVSLVSGSYVALTVLGRPPGLPQIPLEEDDDDKEEEHEEEGGDVGQLCSPSAPHSPAQTGVEQSSSTAFDGDDNKSVNSQKLDSLQKMLTKEQQELQTKEEEYDRNPRPKLLKEIQEAKKNISRLQEQLSKAAQQVDKQKQTCTNRITRKTKTLLFSPPFVTSFAQDSKVQCCVNSPPYHLNPQIIGAEDDYFDSQQEQINGQCSCFQSIELLKCRPAHLAVFLHHVVSQFDPAPLLCYLYADLHKQTSSKESRRFFIEFHSLFMDRTANLKVAVPETLSAELEKRRLELIPEELCKQYTQLLQDTLLPDLHKNLEDFRHKRSMGLTLAEDELSKLDSDQGKDQQALEKECSCAEHILSKIEDILLTSQPTEEEKCTTMQYVILTYMKHLGVKVKEPRGLEQKRARINFLPKIKKSIKPEKEGEEKVKKPRFPNILGPPRRLSRVDSTSGEVPFIPHHCIISPVTINTLNASEPGDTRRMEAQCAVSSADVLSEDDQGAEVECEEDPLNWQSVVSPDILSSLQPQEIKRQEVINGCFAHQMTAIRKRSETSVIGQIGDDLLGWFSGDEEEKIRRAVATFCSNQPSALELIKTKKKKDQRFALFMQEAESNRLCRRLQLKDIIPVEMQRVTKYPLLLDNIAKYTEDGEERKKVKKAAECCKKILNHVNQAVKEAENKQRLEDYQRRLDLSSLKQNENPVVLELKNLDLTKRKMVHEGPLSWKIMKDKRIDMYTILLEDIMVLLQKQDERLVLKFHGKNLASTADAKQIFSPVIKLSTVLVRPVATNHRSFFVLSMSDNVAQIYELTAQTISDQRTLHPDVFFPDAQAPANTNPFDGMKSEDEEEELALADRQEEEEEDGEVDEAELEAFLDGQLADRLQEESQQENQQQNSLSIPSSKAEEALRTCEFTTRVSKHPWRGVLVRK
uniref:Rho guanine nucleotide exchange factor (GEF) 12b n=1 Tax=Sphaeramia orbicularis TaxID=375764 RepID=A0A672ZFG3_9TELE